MSQLITTQPRRLFAFGCSFTDYCWPTWVDIISKELQIPYYNYGQAGAGNQYIFNKLMQADSYYQFDENDLVIVCWTNVAREDRYAHGHWETPGNIYTQSSYDEKFVRQWADPVGYAVRDFATIKSISEFLTGRQTQHHFLTMMDINSVDQWHTDQSIDSAELLELYQPYLSKINPSYYSVLWNNNLDIKHQRVKQEVGSYYFDVHPTVAEHLEYLQTIFNNQFGQQTIDCVQQAHEEVLTGLRQLEHVKMDANQHHTLVPKSAWFASQLKNPIKGI